MHERFFVRRRCRTRWYGALTIDLKVGLGGELGPAVKREKNLTRNLSRFAGNLARSSHYSVTQVAR